MRTQKQNLIDSVLASYHPEVKPEEGWEKNLQAFQPVYAAAVDLWWDGHVRGEMLDGACKALVERFQQVYLQASQEWESRKKPRSSRRKTLGKAS